MPFQPEPERLPLEARIARALGLWQAQLLEAPVLSAWVDAQLLALDPLPDLLLALAMEGPEHLVEFAARDFALAIEPPPFALQLGLRALRLKVEDDAACESLLAYGLREVWHEDAYDGDEARLCVSLDHLLSDCDDRPAALDLLRKSLPALRASARLQAQAWLAPLGGLRTREDDGQLVYAPESEGRA